MRKIYPKPAHGIAGKDASESVFSRNHFAGLATYSPEVRSRIASMGLTRVAGSVYECPSTRDFWKINGTKIVKLVGNEVDSGESIPAAPEDNPAQFLATVLDGLEF
jgi:hypothetical protein